MRQVFSYTSSSIVLFGLSALQLYSVLVLYNTSKANIPSNAYFDHTAAQAVRGRQVLVSRVGHA